MDNMDNMENLEIKKEKIVSGIANAIRFLENEMQCVEDECMLEEYQAVISDLNASLQEAKGL